MAPNQNRHIIRTILEHPALLIFSVDAERKARYVNGTLRRLLVHLRHLDHRASTFPQNVAWRHPGGSPYREEDIPYCRSARSGVEIQGERVILELAGGWPVACLVSSSPVRDDLGNTAGAVVVCMMQGALPKEHTHQSRKNLHAMAEEMRTPLAVIRGYAAMGLMMQGSLAGTDKQEFLEAIDAQANRLAAMLDELLESAEG